MKNYGAYVCTARFGVGADAYIGPLGSYEFAENYRENGAFCRVDVGIDPYRVLCKFRLSIGRTESSASNPVILR